MNADDQGGWFCKWCRRFVELNQDRELNVCARCGRPGLRYHPPTNAVSHERAAEFFQRMRGAVEEEPVAASGG